MQIKLWFTAGAVVELQKTEFRHPSLDAPRRCVRGKVSLTDASSGTFQWTPAVQAISALFIRAAAKTLNVKHNKKTSGVLLSGVSGSAASSLDFAISKQPQWLLEMLGWDSAGEALAKRIILRDNPNRKRAGKVSLSLIKELLAPAAIEIYVDDEPISCAVTLAEYAEELEKGFTKRQRASVSESKAKPAVGKARFDLSAPSIRKRLRSTVRQEILTSLHRTNIFSLPELQKTVQSIERNPAYSSLAGDNNRVVSEIDSSLDATARLGVIENEAEARKLLNDYGTLTYAAAAPMPAAVLIFYYLKLEKGLDINICDRFIHAVDIARRLVSKQFSTPPDICTLGMAPAATVLSQQKRCGYYPVMLMPRGSQHIVAPKMNSSKKRGLNYGQYSLISGDPSNPLFYLDNLKRRRLVKQNSVASFHAEPFESQKHLSSGDPDARAILFYPYYNLNVEFNNCVVLNPGEEENRDNEAILFVSERLYHDPRKVRALDLFVRDAWLTLKNGGPKFEQILDLMLADDEHFKIMCRGSGIVGEATTA